jgi:hypothetical protein
MGVREDYDAVAETYAERFGRRAYLLLQHN